MEYNRHKRNLTLCLLAMIALAVWGYTSTDGDWFDKFLLMFMGFSVGWNAGFRVVVWHQERLDREYLDYPWHESEE